MLTVSDLLHLPYTRDLTEGGIAYALRAVPYLYNRRGSSPYDSLRRSVASAAVELALRRYLSEQNIPFEVKGALPFTEHDRYDVILGGRRCEVKSFLISHPDQISQIKQEPQILLKAPALVASDQHAGDGHSPHDLYLFAFLCGRIMATGIEADQPYYLVHAMPEAWNRPSRWNPLGRLALKSEAEERLTIEIGGQDEGRAMRSCSVELLPRTRVEIEDRFFSLSYVHIKASPRARIGISSPVRKETHLISGQDWSNIWIYGTDVYLVGYLAREEFSRRASGAKGAHFIQAGARVFQYNETHVKNLAVPMSELKPLAELFARGKT